MTGNGRKGGESSKAKDKRGRSDNDSEGSGQDDARKRAKSLLVDGEEIKFVVKFKDRSDKGINPLKLSADIKDKLGDVLNVKVMMNGNMLIFCRNESQRRKAMQVKHLLGRPIECYIPGGGLKNIKGVIYVSQDIAEKAIVDQAIGEDGDERVVEEAKRFKKEGTAVLLTFRKEVTTLPTRVYLGYMSFRVKEYSRPPMRCYKCQRYGHAAAACRGDRRCGKCGGNHEFAECSATEAKCCNCGGNHITSFRGCEHHVRATEVEKVRAGGEMSYAEAVRKVEAAKTVRAGAAAPPVGPVGREGGFHVTEKHAFMAFLVDILCAFTARKTQGPLSRDNAVQMVVEASGRSLGALYQVDPGELYSFIVQKEKEKRDTVRNEQLEERAGNHVGDDDT